MVKRYVLEIITLKIKLLHFINSRVSWERKETMELLDYRET